jgi:hypothetical protein
MSFRTSSLSRWAFGSLVVLLGAAPGCKADDAAQVAVVQGLASALATPRRNLDKSACAFAVPEHQSEMTCDGFLLPILHYSPGLAGSRITRRGPSSSWLSGIIGRPVHVPVHYEGRFGSGNLDVTLRKTDGRWGIYGLLPVP